MPPLITGLVLGTELADAPPGMPLSFFPRVGKGDAVGLYRARLAAMRSVRTPFFLWLDGDDDRLLPGFMPAIQDLLILMRRTGAGVGYMGEDEHGVARPGRPFSLDAYLRDFRLIHHGVLCRTIDFRRVPWPRGCYSFEVLGYGHVAKVAGAVHVPSIGYAYRPDSEGARLWPSYLRAVNNSLAWLQGLPGAHTKAELGCSFCADTRRRLLSLWST